MAPSFLKTMSGDGKEVEGNYASLDFFQSGGGFFNTDLGLTLLPGSQTQNDDEDRPNSLLDSGLIESSEADEQRSTSTELSSYARDLCTNGNSESQTVGSPSTNPTQIAISGLAGNCDVEDQSGVQTPCRDRSHRAQKRRKLECQEPHRLVHLTSSERSLAFGVSDGSRCSTDFIGDDQLQVKEAQRSSANLPAQKSNLAEHREVLEFSESTDPKGNIANFLTTGVGSLTEESPEEFVLRRIRHTPEVLESRSQILRSTKNDSEVQDVESRIYLPSPTPLEESSRLTESHFTVQCRYHHPPTAGTNNPSHQPSQQLDSSQATSKDSTSVRRAVLNSVTKTASSWTSHFPKASEKTYIRRDARAPATFPAAAASLVTNRDPRSASIADSAFTTTKVDRDFAAVNENRSQASLTGIFTPLDEIQLQRDNVRSCPSLNTAILKTYQHNLHRRTSSLPNLPSRYCLTMDTARDYEQAFLPTPPNEKRTLPLQQSASNSLSSPVVAAGILDRANDGVDDAFCSFLTPGTPSREHHGGQNSYNPSIQPNTYSPINTMSYYPKSAQHQHLPPDSSRTFQQASYGALFPVDCRTTLALQQSQDHTMQPKDYYSHAEVQDLFNKMEQLWETRLNKSRAEQQSRMLQEHSRSQNLSQQNARLASEVQQFKLNFEKLNKERELLNKRLQFHEQGQLFQHYQYASKALAHQQQQEFFLQHEVRRLQADKDNLISQIDKFAAQSRPNTTVAKNILQSLSSAAPSAPIPEYENDRIAVTESNITNIPISRPHQVSSSQQLAANTTPLQASQYAQPQCSSDQPKRQTNISTAEHVSPQNLTHAFNHSPSTISTTSLGSSPTADIASSALSSIPDVVEYRDSGFPPGTLIDLTDDSHPASSSGVTTLLDPQMQSPFAHAASVEGLDPADNQAHLGMHNVNTRKSYEWLDGLNPMKSIHTPGVIFGLPSSKEAIAAKPKPIPQKNAKINATKTRDAMNALEATQKKRPSNNADEIRAIKAAKQKAYREKRKVEQSKSSKQTSSVSTSASKLQTQGRKSAKIQMRQQAASQSSTEEHSPVEQFTLDGRPMEARSDKSTSSPSTHARNSQQGFDSDPLFDDDEDMEVIHFPDPLFEESQDESHAMVPPQSEAIPFPEMEDEDDDAQAIAEFEAQMEADAMAEAYGEESEESEEE